MIASQVFAESKSSSEISDPVKLALFRFAPEKSGDEILALTNLALTNCASANTGSCPVA